MAEFYLEIRLVHIWAVVASGLLFFVRGIAIAAGQEWGRAAFLRYLSYTIDTVLLTAALMLVVILQQYPFQQAWLTVKIFLLVVYIVLGVIAFRKARTTATRSLFWAAALGIYLYIVSIARTRHPFGVLGVWFGW